MKIGGLLNKKINFEFKEMKLQGIAEKYKAVMANLFFFENLGYLNHILCVKLPILAKKIILK